MWVRIFIKSIVISKKKRRKSVRFGTSCTHIIQNNKKSLQKHWLIINCLGVNKEIVENIQ